MNSSAKNLVKTCGLATFGFASLFAASTSCAQDSLSFVGELDTYLGYYKPAGAKGQDNTFAIDSNGMTTSYAGVHGSHDLGDGLKVVGALEMFLRPDTGEVGRFSGDVMFARAANFGLAGDFGQVTLGRNTNPYFLSVILMNPYGDSFVFSPMVLMSFGGGGIYGDSGWSNSIAYSTPGGGAWSGSLIYAAGEKQGDTSSNKFAANTFYKSGNFGFTAAVQKISGIDGLMKGDDQTDGTIGGSYTFGKNTVYLQYQTMSDSLAAGDIDRDTLVASASIAVGSDALYLSIGSTKTSTPLLDYDRKIFSAVYNHPLGKSVDLYIAFANDDPELAEQTGQTFGIGGRFRF